MEHVVLSNGVKMPKLGFGVFQIPKEETVEAVKQALQVGYRHIDTAQSYMNESEVGQAIQESPVHREDIFLTTKIWISHYGYERAKQSVYDSLERLQTDYLDLMLLHQPFGDYYGAYQALVDLYKEGVIRSIGVSNFYPDRLADIALFAEIPPHVNQIEAHPFHQQWEAHDVMKQYEVQMQAWAPFAEGKNGLFQHDVLQAIADKHHKSIAQVVLRWLTQRDIVVLAKSVNPERMTQNLMSFDFTLDESDMATIRALDEKQSLFFSHQDPHMVATFHQWISDRGI